MDPYNDDLEASQQVTDDAAAEVASLSCSISGGAGGATHFQAELLAHVQTGHRGLETALQLLCERLLDWERTQEVSL